MARVKTINELADSLKPIPAAKGVLGILLVLAGLAIVLASPLLLYFGLALMGLPVTLSWSTYFGCILVSAFLKVATTKSKS